MLRLPWLYAIVDAGVLGRRGLAVVDFAEELKAAGVRQIHRVHQVTLVREALRMSTL